MTPDKIADLLAHRDGERLDPQRAAEFEASVDSRAELAVLRQLKHELNELPLVAPPVDAWAQIQARTSKQPSSWGRFTQRFPVAMAATIALAAMLGIVVWDPANLQSERPDGSAVRVADLSAVANASQANRYAALVNRSQQLESALLYQPEAAVTWSEDQQALLYRIADLDSELNAAPAGELPSLASRERLWEQRVLLLQSLAQSRRVSAQSAVF